MKRSLISVGGILFFLLAACGPFAEQTSTMTASAWTPTPQPSSTPIPSPTPTSVPYDLDVSVVDEDGAPIVGAIITSPESGNGNVVVSGDTGKYVWKDLPGAAVTLKVAAQGYLPIEQTATLSRGLSEISVVMKRDPYGLLPSTACASDEKLRYMEDFQSGITNLAHYNDGGSPVPLGPAVD